MMDNVTTCPSCGAKNRLNPASGAVARCGRCKTPLLPTSPVTVDDESLVSLVNQTPVPILLDLWAPWCGPCRMLAPTLEQLTKELSGQVVVAKMNIDQNQATASRYRVDSIPTLLVFKQGQMVQKMVGLQPKATIVEAIRGAM